MDAASIDWPAVFVAALIGFVIGGLWYSPVLFGKAWMKEVGMTEEDAQGGMGRIFGLTFVLSLIIALNLELFLGPQATLAGGLAAGAAAGIGWVATSIGILYLFDRRSLRLFFIEAGYFAVTFTLMGGLLGLWN